MADRFKVRLAHILPRSIAMFLLILASALFLVPVVFVLFTALKSKHDLAAYPLLSVPKSLHFENFLKAWNEGRLSSYVSNSAFISIVKVPLGILISSLAAFALTRMRFRWSVPVFMFILVGMMVPMQATLVSLNMAIHRLGVANTYASIIYIYLGFGIPYSVLILWGFMKSIPIELDEAALIDGCSDFRRFASVVMPLTKPALAAILILDFLATWNEFILAQIFLTKDSMKTVTTGLMTFIGQHFADYTLLNAGVVLTMIPTLAVYLAFQKYFVSGVAGAVKG
jgi:raffinose/stachyose/melibiose transport system permease protein